MTAIPSIIGTPFIAYQGKSEVGSTTVVAPALADIPVGWSVIMVIAMTANSSIYPTISSVADGHSNTYALGGGNGEGSAQNGTNNSIRVVRGTITTQVNSGDNMTVTISPTRTKWAVVAVAFPDLLASPLDLSVAGSGSASSISAGASGAMAARAELLCWCIGVGNVPVPTLGTLAPAGVVGAWTVAHYETTSGSADRGAILAYRYNTTKASVTPTGILSSSTVYSSSLLTYKVNRPVVSVYDGSTEIEGCALSEWTGASEVTACTPQVA